MIILIIIKSSENGTTSNSETKKRKLDEKNNGELNKRVKTDKNNLHANENNNKRGSMLSVSQILDLDNTFLMDINSQAIAAECNYQYTRCDESNTPPQSSSGILPVIKGDEVVVKKLKSPLKEVLTQKKVTSPLALKRREKSIDKLSITEILSADNSFLMEINCEEVAAQNNINTPAGEVAFKPSDEDIFVEYEDNLLNLTQALVNVCQKEENFLTQITDCMKSFNSEKNVEIVNIEATSSVFVRQLKEGTSDSFAFKMPAIPNASSSTSTSKKVDFFGLTNHHKKFLLETKNIVDLYDWQYECLNLATINEKSNLIYALPTSGGKSLVAEVLILRELLVGKKNAILLLPFVSIVQEKIHDLMPFAMQYSFLVEEYCSGKGTIPPTQRKEKNSLYIATIEKCQILIDSLIEAKRLGEIGLIVVDELHMIGDKHRGQNLELLLTKIMYLNMRKRSKIQIVGMSATIENINEIARFVDADVYSRNFRPVELKEYIKMDDNLFYIDPKAESISETFKLERKNIGEDFNMKQRSRDPDHISFLVNETIAMNSSCLIFCASKKNCESVAILLVDTLPVELRSNHKSERKFLIESIKQDSNGRMCETLIKTLPFGIAYHHSGLTTDERRRIEDAFKHGIINVICCTSTLAAGVNLPAGRVIIRSPNIGKDFLPLTTYKQMVGRAGRAGKSAVGDSILICKKSDYQQVVQLLTSRMDLTTSSYLNNPLHFRSMILNLLGSKFVWDFKGIVEFIKCSLAYVQIDTFARDMFGDVREVLKNLLSEGALSYKSKSEEMRTVILKYVGDDGTEHSIYPDDELKISKMGEAAVNSGKSLEDARQIESDMRKAYESLVLTQSLHLLYIVAPRDVIASIHINYQTFSELFFDLERIDSSIVQTAKAIGISMAQVAKMRTSSSSYSSAQTSMFKRFYVAMMLYELWNGRDIFDVAKRFKVDRGVVSKLMSSASSEAYSIFKFCEVFEEFWVFKEILENFSKRLQYCCSLELLPLMELPSVKIGRAKMMYAAGIKSIMDVAALTPEEFSRTIKFINVQQATRVIRAAKYMLRTEFDDNCEKLFAMKDVLKK